MKTLFAMLAATALISNSALAEDTISPPASPSTAKEIFQQMTPEQKQALKDQGKATAQEKQAAWQQMSPEEKQASRSAMQSKMQERATKFRANRRH